MYQQVGIQVPAYIKLAEFSHLQIPKSLVDNPIDFPFTGSIPEAVLSLVQESNLVLICYREMIVEVSRVPTPKK